VIGRLYDNGQMRDVVVDRRGVTGDTRRYVLNKAKDEIDRRSAY
jgi:hypothetical protein